MAPREGFEPPTNWLTANCSTTELSRNKKSDFYLSFKRKTKPIQTFKNHFNNILLNLLLVNTIYKISNTFKRNKSSCYLLCVTIKQFSNLF